MTSAVVVWALSVLAVQGAVLNNEDTLLKRIARSPGCNKCSGHPHPPPPPPPPPPAPFGQGAPPPPQIGTHAGSSSHSDQASGFEHSFKDSGSSGHQQSLQGNGFQQNGFNAGSSASAHAVSGVAGYNQNARNGVGFSGNQQGFGGGQQKGFNAGSAGSAQAAGVPGYDKAAYKNSGSGNQQGGFQQKGFETGSSSGAGGALSSLNEAQGLSAGKQGCSTCGKSNYAISNAKSNSGSATAISVNG